MCPQAYTKASPSSRTGSIPSGAPYRNVAIRGGWLRAGVLLLVALPPVDDTDCISDVKLAGPVSFLWLLAARGLLEVDAKRFSFDSRACELFTASFDDPKLEGVATFDFLVGVAGTSSSSGHPLNLLSYDRWVLDAELRTPVLARVGVLGESSFVNRKDEFGVAASERVAAGLGPLPDELAGLEAFRVGVAILLSLTLRVASDDGLLNTEGLSFDLFGEGEFLAFCCCAWRRTRNRAFSTSRFRSCSTLLREMDLCRTFSTSRSRELVLNWRWRLSFSALRIAISLLVVWDLFNAVSLVISSSNCFCCAVSLAARSSAMFSSLASLAVNSSSLVCCFAIKSCSFSRSARSFFANASSLSLSVALARLSSGKTLSLQPLAS